eukprot:g15902.t1
MRSLRPGLGKLPIVAVIVVVDAADPRPELLASAIESGVDAVMRRPLERAVLTSCVGEVLRRHASVEFVYKDVVGEVETFNYPRFILEGFQLLGAAGESSLGGGGDSDGFNDIGGEAVRTYTLQTGCRHTPVSQYRCVTCRGTAVRSTGGNAIHDSSNSSGGNADANHSNSGRSDDRPERERRRKRGFGGPVLKTEDFENDGQGGHVKISSPSLRPRLYLYPGDRGYVGGGSATGTSPSGDGGGGNSGTGGSPGGVGAADRRAESERQVSHELAPFVKRRAPALGDPATSAGLHKGTLARTMKLVENTFSFTKGQDAETASLLNGAWQAKGRSAPSSVPGFPFAAAGAAATAADGQNDNTGGNPQDAPTATATAAPCGVTRAGGSWKAAPRRAPLPESGNPVSQKKIFSATGTQGRRAATRAGMFDEVTRSHQTNTNPTEIASTADLRSALGVGMTGEAAARAVIGRMMKKRIQAKRKAARLAADSRACHGRPGGGGFSGGRRKVVPRADGLSVGDKQADRSRTRGNNEPFGGRQTRRGKGPGGNRMVASARPRANKSIKGIAGSGTKAASSEEGMFKAVLSSLAKKRLRAGLLEIKTNPTDVLRCGFVEIEPARYGSTALGCHLMKGWAEQKAGNMRRALGHYRRAVASEPENVEALFCKAVLSAQLMELFDALKDFSAAISFKLDEITKASLQLCALRKKAGKTMGSGHVTTTANNSRGTGGASRGAAALTAGRGPGGTQNQERGNPGESGESNVNLAHLYGNRALVHVCLGDDASALDDLDRAVARDTRNITYRSNRALILRRVGDFRGAQQDYSRIRALQTLEQAAADRSAACTRATFPAAGQQHGTTALEPPAPTASAAQHGATVEPSTVVGNWQNRDYETPPPPSRPAAADSSRPKTGAAELSACPRPSTSPSSIGPPPEQNVAEKNRENNSSGDVHKEKLKDGEVVATTASLATGRLNEAIPGVKTKTTPPTTTGVNATTTIANNNKNNACSDPNTHDDNSGGGGGGGGGGRSSSSTDKARHNQSDIKTSSSPDTPTVVDKIDVRPSEEWSDQFRDRRLMEDTFRRRALLRQLFSPDAESEEEYPEDEYDAVAGAGGKRRGGNFRKKSGQGASLVEFKTSLGLSAKGELFDDLFCRPSFVDEALTTEPGRRTPEQVKHVVEALAASPMFVGLDEDTLAEIGNAAEYRVLEKMAPAFLQGEEMDAMAVVLSGRVAVKMRRADLSVVTADELGPGETFGEACLLEEHRALRRSCSNNDDDDDNDRNGGNKDNTAPREGAKEDKEGGTPRDFSTPRRKVTVPSRETESHEPSLEAPKKSDACSVPGEAGLVDAVDPSRAGGPNPNPYAGRSMETYQTLEPTRLALILKADFHRIPGLLKHCSHAFKRRLEAIKFSGLFGGWDHEDLMRLARMSRIHRHASKSVLLMQRKEPSHLHIMLSGTCTVTKYPDRLAAVRRKINEIGAALYRIKSKYAYHRDVRTKVAMTSSSSSSSPAVPKASNPFTGNGNSGAHIVGTADGRPASAPVVGRGQMRLPRTLVAESTAPLSHVTSTEVRKAELEREMRKWKRTLALIRRKDGDVVDTSQTQSVGTLQYPQFFGEMCLLVPDGGEALGTVSTDTLVETVSMSKFVLQTFHVTDTFLQGVRQKSSIYPEDINLAKAIEAERWWEVRRRELVLEVPR